MPQFRHLYPPRRINRPAVEALDWPIGFPGLVKIARMLGRQEARRQAKGQPLSARRTKSFSDE